jgi:hypothetical protein
MITHSYNAAVEQAFVLHDHQHDDPDIAEKLLLLGYIAGLQDTSRMLNESVMAATERGKAGRMYSIAQDKLSRLGRAVMERAGVLKV